MRRLILILVLFALGSLATPALAAGYSVTVQTDRASYVGIAQIAISGTVSPVPGPNTAVIVVVSNPNHATVDIQDDPVNSATGSFSQVTVAGGTISCGGSPCWIAGTYLVNATWAGYGASAIMTTTFAYVPSPPASTSVSCAPASFATGATSKCTASVSGGAGTSIDGETLTFTQTGGTGSVSFPSAATCTLSGNSCSITVTGTSLGQATIQASYPGDAVNAASSGTASVTVLAATTTSVSCTPSLVDIGGASTCTATVTGATGTITGETITFSQPSGETGSVTIPLARDVQPWFRRKLLDIRDRRNPRGRHDRGDVSGRCQQRGELWDGVPYGSLHPQHRLGVDLLLILDVVEYVDI